MKKRKLIVKNKKFRNSVLVLFVFLGIGYATLQTTLSISGDLTVKKYSIPVIKEFLQTDSTAFRNYTYREKIVIVNFSDEINPPNNVLNSWDISADQDNSVMSYITANANDNTKYDLYIQEDGALYANPNSGYLFYNFNGLNEINNIEVLNTSLATNMAGMFQRTGYDSTSFTLDLGDYFDTSNVTFMSYMFISTGSNSTVFTLDLGDKFYTSNVTNMNGMFCGTGYANDYFELDLSTFNFSNVTDYEGIFGFNGIGAAFYYPFKTTQKIYVGNATAQNWIINHSGNSNLTTANVLIK